MNDPAIELDKIIERLTGDPNPRYLTDTDTIIIYLGNIPDEHREHRDIARYAVESWAAVMGYQVEETNNTVDAHITFTLAPREGEILMGAGGRAGTYEVIVAEELDTVDDRNQVVNLYLHEVGHILGLVHPHEIYTPENGLEKDYLAGDSHLISVMSYVLDSANTITPGVNSMSLTLALADIIAIQKIYTENRGEAVRVNHSNTFYGYDPDIENKVTDGEQLSVEEQNWFRFTHPGLYLEVADFDPRITIYDTGGIDTLDLSNEGPGNPGEIHTHRGDYIEIIWWIRSEDGEILPIITGQTINLNPGWTSNVYGGQANLVIANNTIIENLIAGQGDDHVTGNSADNTLDGRDGHDELTGGPGDDTLLGGAGNDVLEGDDGTDTLNGGAGNDRLSGGAGNDILTGGTGTDVVDYREWPTALTLRLHNSVETIETTTGDTFPGRVTVEWVDENGSTQTESVIDIEGVVGSQHNDTLAGDRRDNLLYGLGGDDRLFGGPGGGNDTLSGGRGNDQLFGGTGNDRLEGGEGADRLSGGPGIDTASFSHSEEGVTVRLHNGQAAEGDAAGDTFQNSVDVAYTDANGLAQTDTLPDIENLAGSVHADTLAGDRRDNRVDGNSGDDVIYGGPGGGDDLLLGNRGNDRIYGGKGDDRLYGNRGEDLLVGGPGDDRLNGGANNDRLTGGEGNDIFVFDPGEYDDTITDFTIGEDKVDLRAFNLENTTDLVFMDENGNIFLDRYLLKGVEVLFENLTDRPSDDHFIT